MSLNAMPLQEASYNDDLLVEKDIKARFTMDGFHITKTVISILEYG